MLLYAAVDEENGRVWGVGDSPEFARFDANTEVAKSGIYVSVEKLKVHHVTMEDVRRIVNGETAWPMSPIAQMEKR